MRNQASNGATCIQIRHTIHRHTCSPLNYQHLHRVSHSLSKIAGCTAHVRAHASTCHTFCTLLHTRAWTQKRNEPGVNCRHKDNCTIPPNTSSKPSNQQSMHIQHNIVVTQATSCRTCARTANATTRLCTLTTLQRNELRCRQAVDLWAHTMTILNT